MYLKSLTNFILIYLKFLCKTKTEQYFQIKDFNNFNTIILILLNVQNFNFLN